MFRPIFPSGIINSGDSSLRWVAILVSRISTIWHFKSLFGDLPVLCRKKGHHLYMASSKSWSKKDLWRGPANDGKGANLALYSFFQLFLI